LEAVEAEEVEAEEVVASEVSCFVRTVAWSRY
jgi:hypothetical protein